MPELIDTILHSAKHEEPADNKKTQSIVSTELFKQGYKM